MHRYIRLGSRSSALIARRLARGSRPVLSWNIVTSRGCPYACNWCAKPTFGRRYSVRSPEEVAGEMSRIAREIRPDHLWFTDDILQTSTSNWISTESLADEIRATPASRSPSPCSRRVNLMTQQGVAALARAGARCGWKRIRVRVAENPRCDGQGDDRGSRPSRDTPAEGACDQGMLVHPARLPIGKLGRSCRNPRSDSG